MYSSLTQNEMKPQQIVDQTSPDNKWSAAAVTGHVLYGHIGHLTTGHMTCINSHETVTEDICQLDIL